MQGGPERHEVDWTRADRSQPENHGPGPHLKVLKHHHFDQEGAIGNENKYYEQTVPHNDQSLGTWDRIT